MSDDEYSRLFDSGSLPAMNPESFPNKPKTQYGVGSYSPPETWSEVSNSKDYIQEFEGKGNLRKEYKDFIKTTLSTILLLLTVLLFIVGTLIYLLPGNKSKEWRDTGIGLLSLGGICFIGFIYTDFIRKVPDIDYSGVDFLEEEYPFDPDQAFL